MSAWCRGVVVGLVAVACLAPAPATAQATGEGDTARALAMYEEAARLYQRGEFGAAAELLREAYALYDHPTLLYNLARSIEGTGDLSTAIEAYERYLAVAPDAPDHDLVRARVSTLRTLMAEREALIRERTRAVSERDRIAQSVQRDEPLSHGPWPWVVTGVGALGLGTGSVLWVLALEGRDDAAGEPEQREAFRLHSHAETLATWGTASLIGGGVLLVAGLGWWIYGQLFQPYVEGFRDLTVAVGPGGLALEVGF